MEPKQRAREIVQALKDPGTSRLDRAGAKHGLDIETLEMGAGDLVAHDVIPRLAAGPPPA